MTNDEALMLVHAGETYGMDKTSAKYFGTLVGNLFQANYAYSANANNNTFSHMMDDLEKVQAFMTWAQQAPASLETRAAVSVISKAQDLDGFADWAASEKWRRSLN